MKKYAGPKAPCVAASGFVGFTSRTPKDKATPKKGVLKKVFGADGPVLCRLAARPPLLGVHTVEKINLRFCWGHYAPLAQKGPPVRPEGTPIPGTGKNKTFPGASPGKVYE